ncbi:F-box/LRR-repeat protein 2, partial [Fragariocoptes setiger]
MMTTQANTAITTSSSVSVSSVDDIVNECQINQVLPRELILKLALDGDNWQDVSLFDFRAGVKGRVVEYLSSRCGNFLKRLTLRGCRSVTDSSIDIFANNCRNLEEINLDDCKQLTDRSCLSLANYCPRLTSLNIASCEVTDESLIALGTNCKNLQHIDISGCNKITGAGIRALADGCPKLRSFISIACTNTAVNNESLQYLASKCKQLRTINLNACSSITDEAVIALSENCDDIVNCCLSKCTNIADQSLIALSQHCPKLKTLGLIGCNLLTDAGFQALTRGCKYLENLDLEGCVQITDQTLYYLTLNCLKLKRLVLSYCEFITDEGIKHLGASKCLSENLQFLELDNCPQLSDVAIGHLANCKRLKRLDIYDNQMITRQAIQLLLCNMFCGNN